ncbi:WD40-repeat-containing domain protein [Boletus reticuloceps]|uniref:WD40-repeat-containing domain protein n=1 Tax=Boletus reticuloceps TaxID=495285 RepID=A0A8I3A4E6_9AGAM|nr:WD40-repeat-containing domain protein [Boletus reticuloceps]
MRVIHSLTGHRGPINCISFAEDGSCVASGGTFFHLGQFSCDSRQNSGDDGKIILWSLDDGTLLQHINARQGPVVSLQWLHHSDNVRRKYLISGGAAGTVHLWRIEDEMLASDVFCTKTVFDGAVQDICINQEHRLVSVTGLGRVVLYKLALDGPDILQLLSAHPPMLEQSLPALAITSHFYDGGKGVIICYLDSKEVITWNVTPWSRRWRQQLLTRIGSTAHHDATCRMAVWNLRDGIDLYQISDNPTGQLTFVRKFRVRIRRNLIASMQFDIEGKRLFSGGDNGEVCIWDVETGLVAQVLSHGRGRFGCFL